MGLRLAPGVVWRNCAGILLAALVVGGCASGPPLQTPLLDRTPFFPQSLHQCGPAALATVLVDSGVDTTPMALAERVYLPGRRGSLQFELLAAARRLQRVPYRVAPNLESVAAELRAGHSVLVLQNLGLPVWPRWHYAVIVGIDGRHVLLRSGRQRLKRANRLHFERSWRYAGYWGFVALKPGEWPGDPEPMRWLDSNAALEQTGALELARAGYALAVERWPDDARFWFALGNVHHAQQELPAALAAYRGATQAAPGLAPAWNNLAQTLGELGCRSAAMQALERATAVAGAEWLPLLADTRRTLPTGDAPGCVAWQQSTP